MSSSACYRLTRGSSTLFCLITCLLYATGCNNTCVSVNLNAPTGSTVAVKTGSSPPSCTLTTANGIVQLEISSTTGGASGSGLTAFPIDRPIVTHLFVTLAGIDIHSSPLASGDTPGWLPIAPLLQVRPLQVDLLADHHANASAAPLPDAIVPTGRFRQIRLRLASQPPASHPPSNTFTTWPWRESTPETNPCGAGTAHCAVMSDGHVWPVTLPPSRPDLRIMLDSAHELYVPPDGAVALLIELDRDRTWVWPSGDSMLFAPVFRVNVHQPFNVSAN